jgi:hypothetical protein
LTDTQALQLGEVAAMVVTYRRISDDKVSDVVAHVIGSFPLGKRKPGFHRDGYFKHMIDGGIWNLGNSALNVLGRDMVIFAEEQVATNQQAILESVFNGNILPLADSLRDKPMYYTMVFPDPRKLLPVQLRQHVQAMVVKGFLSPDEGRIETILLTPSSRSANYAFSILGDMKLASEVLLRTKWKGVVEQTMWGPQIDTWWAYEMVQTSEEATLQKEYNIVRVKSQFDRVMVNAVLKSVERAGRDMAQMRGSLDEKLDPRLVDERLFSQKPQHYWSDEHRWGPNWPFAGAVTNLVENIAPPATPSPEASVPATQPPGA